MPTTYSRVRQAAPWLVVAVLAALYPPGWAQDLEGLEEGGPAARDRELRFEVRLFAGYSPTSGAGVAGCWLPLSIEVENERRDYAGYFQITGADEATTYRFPFSSPKGSIKLFQTLIHLQDSCELQVAMVDHRWGPLLGRDALVTVNAVPGGRLVDLVLAPKPGEHRLLGRPPQPGAEAPIVWYGDPMLLPRSWAGYEGLGSLVWDGRQMPALTEQHGEALLRWIETGGHLVLAAGADWAMLREGLFADWLPVLPTSSAVIATRDLGAALGVQPADREGSIVVATGAVAEDARVTHRLGDLPLVVERSLGSGKVIFLAFSLRETGLADWEALAPAIHGIVQSYRSVVRHGLTAGWLDRLSASLRTTTYTALPSPGLIAQFLLLYVALLVPLNYFLWSKLGRRELAWICVPVLALGFGYLAYHIGAAGKASLLKIKSISVVDAAPDARRGEARTFYSLYSPTHHGYDIAFPAPDAMPWHLSEEGVLMDEDAAIGGGTLFRAAERLEVEHAGMPLVRRFMIHQWSSRNLAVSHTIDLATGVSGEVNLGGESIQLWAWNRTPYDFDELFVVNRDGKAFALGDLAAGMRLPPRPDERFEISLEDERWTAIDLPGRIAPLRFPTRERPQQNVPFGQPAPVDPESAYAAAPLLHAVPRLSPRETGFFLLARFDGALLTPILDDATPPGAHGEAEHYLFMPLPGGGEPDQLKRLLWSVAIVDENDFDEVINTDVGSEPVLSTQTYLRLRPQVSISPERFTSIRVRIETLGQAPRALALYDPANPSQWEPKGMDTSGESVSVLLDTGQARRNFDTHRGAYFLRLEFDEGQRRYNNEFRDTVRLVSVDVEAQLRPARSGSENPSQESR